MKPKKPAKATLKLRFSKPLTREIRRIAREQIDAACHALQEEKDTRKAVHEARKSLKKLRAILQLVSQEFSRKQYCQEKRAFQEAARLLAPMRDAEVQITTLNALIQGSGFDSRDFSIVRKDFEAFAEQLTQNATESMCKAVEILRSARKRIPHWPLSDPLEWKALEREIQRTYKKGRKALQFYRQNPTPETFHAWRKQVKELWYHLRITEKYLPDAVAEAIDTCDKIGEIAGNAHDLDVLRDTLSTRLEGTETAHLLAKIDERQPEYYQTAIAQGQKLYAEKPREFMKRGCGK